jgi:hypothetical protein
MILTRRNTKEIAEVYANSGPIHANIARVDGLGWDDWDVDAQTLWNPSWGMGGGVPPSGCSPGCGAFIRARFTKRRGSSTAENRAPGTSDYELEGPGGNEMSL